MGNEIAPDARVVFSSDWLCEKLNDLLPLAISCGVRNVSERGLALSLMVHFEDADSVIALGSLSPENELRLKFAAVCGLPITRIELDSELIIRVAQMCSTSAVVQPSILGEVGDDTQQRGINHV